MVALQRPPRFDQRPQTTASERTPPRRHWLNPLGNVGGRGRSGCVANTGPDIDFGTWLVYNASRVCLPPSHLTVRSLWTFGNTDAAAQNTHHGKRTQTGGSLYWPIHLTPEQTMRLPSRATRPTAQPGGIAPWPPKEMRRWREWQRASLSAPLSKRSLST